MAKEAGQDSLTGRNIEGVQAGEAKEGAVDAKRGNGQGERPSGGTG